MSDVTIYHNPRCSKSRQTLELIRGRGVEPNIIEYLKTPPEADILRNLLTLLDIPPIQLMRTKEAAFSELGLKDKSDDPEALIEAMASNPILIERPIVVNNGAARLGRPPESVLEIL